MRRFLILLLIFTLLLGALPCYSVPVDGLSLYEWEDELMKKCEDILKVVHHDGYFDGGCAAWTSDQLRYNDVGYWYKGKYSSAYDDGNKWFYDLDEKVALEFLKHLLSLKNISLTGPKLKDFLVAIKTYSPEKKFNLPEDRLITIHKTYLKV